MRKEMIQELGKLAGQSAFQNIEALEAEGRKRRAVVPLAGLGRRPVIERDPVAFIDATESKLISALLPQRHARMAQSPAAFFRGTAELMAYDLSHEVASGIRVLCSGDAHLQNFGFYASPERNLLFDLNDFDEAAPNPFEFDVKRLVTSVYLLGAQNHYDEAALDHLAAKVAKTYRKTLKKAFKTGALTRFYASSAVRDLTAALPDQADVAFVERISDRAQGRDNESVVAKYTEVVDGQLRFKVAPPRSARVSATTQAALVAALGDYQHTTRADVALLLAQYRVTDLIRHSVGIGSFGTTCYLVLMTGLGGSHLVLQVKEALPRRRELTAGPRVDLAREVSEGQRIIAAQQILQKASDPFLGWLSLGDKSYYVRQFRDMKESIDVTALSFSQFTAYCRITGYLLAMAHAQSPTAAIADGYLNHDFDGAIQHWAKGYLGQVIDDYAAFIARYAPAK
ncbi:DUF2252 domain-containing protein [Lacticaseibacillus parakribbianus]|uniref:DUF2252 domain-containing protein n=1 Tax=Lacticaseibacillus parakribbianus TaxID=2970927 RepID=UPI0021CB542F|nr:DUF2252 domain-containing protein [Lacticaseibacillus parakribbianus]